MDHRGDSVMSDSPPSAGDDGSDYEAPASVKYSTQKRGRPGPRVALRPRRNSMSRFLFRLPEDDPEDEGAAEYDNDTAVTDTEADPDFELFRSSGRRDRPGRTQIDHDVFEGLPIRQWRQVDAPVGPPPVVQPLTGKNSPWPELPMPRDWQMLPEVSQQLLRAARAGKLYKPPTPPIDDEEDKVDDEADTAVKDTPKGFVTRKWSQVPRHLEAPEQEYLAKRRKGLSSTYATGASQQAQVAPTGAVRTTKVRRTDADGNSVVYEVQALEGQPIDGEVLEEATATESVPVVATVAPGTVIEGVGVANAEGVVVAATEHLQAAPSRRKPPPPRRKKNKGPGRGHKKVVLVEPGMEGALATAGLAADGTPLAVPLVLADGSTADQSDTPMLDAPDGDEDSGTEGEEGEDDDEEDAGSEEGELAQTPTPDSGTPAQQQPPAPTSAPTSAPAIEPTSAPSPVQSSLEPTTAPDAVPSAEALIPPTSPPPTDAVIAPTDAPETAPQVPEVVSATEAEPEEPANTSAEPLEKRDRSSSPDEPLAGANTHSRQGSISQVAEPASAVAPTIPSGEAPPSEAEPDLFGSLEKHLQGEEASKTEE